MRGGGLSATLPAPAARGHEAVPLFGSSRLRVGLVNNMPDAALAITERQFASLLGPDVELKLYSLPRIERGEAAQRRLQARYHDVSILRSADVDALIVTGAEPKAPRLADEPFWPGFCGLVDWARAEAVPTIWSCLAAHAAVLHLSGVHRRRLNRKCSGVFKRVAFSRHPLAPTAPSWVPHSRYNTLDPDALTGAGFTLISLADGAGVDSFVGPGGDFVFLQGHPEYDADSLALEYRRDVLRFARGLSPCLPDPPVNAFDRETEVRLSELAQALGGQGPAPLGELSRRVAIRSQPAIWRRSAEDFYARWLARVGARSLAQARA